MSCIKSTPACTTQDFPMLTSPHTHAQSLRQLLFGTSKGPSFSQEWRMQNFEFSDIPGRPLWCAGSSADLYTQECSLTLVSRSTRGEYILYTQWGGYFVTYTQLIEIGLHTICLWTICDSNKCAAVCCARVWFYIIMLHIQICHFGPWLTTNLNL